MNETQPLIGRFAFLWRFFLSRKVCINHANHAQHAMNPTTCENARCAICAKAPSEMSMYKEFKGERQVCASGACPDVLLPSNIAKAWTSDQRAPLGRPHKHARSRDEARVHTWYAEILPV
jgi:hypothetical protein